MPSDGMSANERLYNELCASQFSEWFAEQRGKHTEPKPESCPYCGSQNLIHRRVPLERTDLLVFCDDCGESWDK